ncbi:MAG: SPASM domain-containing protein [Lewinellaceae bacterium]|nr:SPASM domain-containing protein [Lewinellaceae bacterium]
MVANINTPDSAVSPPKPLAWHHNAWRLVRKLTWRKGFNATLVFLSYYLTRLTGKPIQWGLPFSVSVEPTTACNLRCPECPSGLRQFSRPTGNLKNDFFRQTLDDIYRELVFLIFYFQGEPYINPDFLDMVAYAHQRGVYTITSTNGHFLNDANARRTIEAGLDRLIISIDGTTQEVYEQYRKAGNLEVVLQGARNVIKWRTKLGAKHPQVIFQFLVVRPNEHQIEEVKSLAREIGVDEVRLKTAQIYDYQQGNRLIPTQERYARYARQSDGSYQIKNPLLNHCWKLWHACVITWDGLVVPCCFDKDAKYRMGDLKRQSLRQLWHGPAYQAFRRQLLRGRREIDICTNCTEGCRIFEQD